MCQSLGVYDKPRPTGPSTDNLGEDLLTIQCCTLLTSSHCQPTCQSLGFWWQPPTHWHDDRHFRWKSLLTIQLILHQVGVRPFGQPTRQSLGIWWQTPTHWHDSKHLRLKSLWLAQYQYVGVRPLAYCLADVPVPQGLMANSDPLARQLTAQVKVFVYNNITHC